MEEANPISSHYLDGDFLPYSVAESTSIESSSISGLSSMSEASLPNPCDYLSFNVYNAERLYMYGDERGHRHIFCRIGLPIQS